MTIMIIEGMKIFIYSFQELGINAIEHPAIIETGRYINELNRYWRIAKGIPNKSIASIAVYAFFWFLSLWEGLYNRMVIINNPNVERNPAKTHI